MIKKTLPAAIALAGSLGLAGAANAVNVNHDGLGEALLYSYYTTEGGNDTLINITNTSNNVKAVKVRFVEAMNSQEVLDFNLYLSPYDVWTGAVSRSSGGAKLTTADTSCTVPAIPAGGVEFREFVYQGSNYATSQGGPQGTDRTRTGYLEVIEMGVVINEDPADPDAFNPAIAATHVNGVPADCSVLTNAWGGAGQWTADNGRAVNEPDGGLYGSGIIINVAGGTDVAYDAVALDSFLIDGSTEGHLGGTPDAYNTTVDLHADPGTVQPSLQDATAIATLANGATVIPEDPGGTLNRGIDAVSMVLQKESIANDYLTVASLAAGTDWVVTFPTKRFYVNGWTPSGADATVPAAATPRPEPFTSFWTDAEVNSVEGSSCETIAITFYDQEEGEQAPSGVDFSPRPPSGPAFALCYEANVLTINDTGILGGGYTKSNLNLPAAFDAGWINVGLTGTYLNPENSVNYTRRILIDQAAGLGTSAPTATLGLPAIGFSVISFANGDVGGLLSNYAGLTDHKSRHTTVTVTPPVP